MNKQTALQFVDCISDSYKGDDLRINVEFNKGYCVVFLRTSLPYRVSRSLIVCVNETFCKYSALRQLSFSVVKFCDELSIMVHSDDLFGNND